MEKEHPIKESLLLCPICADMPLSEVFQCKNGHMLCHQCILKVGPRPRCPQCRMPFGENKIRNLSVEAILDEVIFDCSFKPLGCNRNMKRNELIAHQKTCGFRAVNICRNLGYHDCKTKVRFVHELIKHLQEAHGLFLEKEMPASKKIAFKTKIEDILTTQSKNLVKYLRMETEFSGLFEYFLVVVKIVTDSSGQASIHCAVLYLDDVDVSTIPNSEGEDEDFMSKIDVDIMQEQKKTLICTWTGPAMNYKVAEDDKKIPCIGVSQIPVGSQTNFGKGTDFELVVNVEMTDAKCLNEDGNSSDSDGSQITISVQPL